uniref:Uncharacterized protein n=1 Tax=viral metagenome TaxID=1070528 RepID=A0A6C0AD18_9ZZZZ
MEFFEKTIENFNSKTSQSIEEHKLYFINSVHKLANEVHSHNTKIDKMFLEQFKDMLEENNYEILNPHIVVEMKDGKPHKVLESWDTNKGVLPHLKFMSEYYIYEGLEINDKFMEEFFDGYNISNSKGQGGNNFGIKFNTYKELLNMSNDKLILKNYSSNNIYSPSKKYFKFDIHLKQSLKPNKSKKETGAFCGRSYKFKIDNYMNLYHPESGLYLMFNKIPYPDIAFILRDHTYLSKKTNYLNFEFNKSVYDSIDNRDNFFENINELIPPNYQEEIIIFKKLRDLFEYTKEESEDIDIDLSGLTNIRDPRDRLLEKYRLKISISNDKLEKLYENYDEFKQLYIEQNAELKDAKRIIQEFEKKEKNTESELVLNLKKEIANLKSNIFEFQKQFYSDELAHRTITQVEQEYLELELKYKKLKDQNANLVDELLSRKELIKTKEKVNKELSEELLMKEKTFTDKDMSNIELKKVLEEKDVELNKLRQILKNKENNDSTALEEALNERIHELEHKNEKLKEVNEKTQKERDEVVSEIFKIKSFMKKF